MLLFLLQCKKQQQMHIEIMLVAEVFGTLCKKRLEFQSQGHELTGLVCEKQGGDNALVHVYSDTVIHEASALINRV